MLDNSVLGILIRVVLLIVIRTWLTIIFIIIIMIIPTNVKIIIN